MSRPHPFRDWGVWEFDDEHPDGWPVCADCGGRQQGHVGFISLGAVHTDHPTASGLEEPQQ